MRIADDGPGIAPDLQRRIFEPFYTTKAVGSGTGLGLDTARRIVADRHTGELTVQSRPGETVFRVRLPRRAALTPALRQLLRLRQVRLSRAGEPRGPMFPTERRTTR